MFCLIKSSLYFYGLELQGYREVVNIPIAKPGRRLYNIRNLVDRSDSIIVQIDATEGNKVITVRSPLQVKKLTKQTQSLKAVLFSEWLLLFFLSAFFLRSYFPKKLPKGKLLSLFVRWIFICILYVSVFLINEKFGFYF